MSNARRKTGAGGVHEAIGPERTCIVTRQSRSPQELVRFVLGPDGAVVPDLARRLPGRGVWVTCERKAVTAAVRTKAFSRAFRTEAATGNDLPETVERLLTERALEALALANKAGLVVAGFGKVETAIARGQAEALVHAAEAQADGVEKLDRKFCAERRQRGCPATVVREFAISQLSLTIGRTNVVHAALKRGGATARFLREAERVAHYRSNTIGVAYAAPEVREQRTGLE